MSARKKVAREAVFDAMIEHGPDGHTDGHDKITDAALAAADSVMFSEAAIERAAKLLCAANNLGLDYWESYHKDSLIKEKFRTQARAVVAALREGA
ncbi:hypothetical protein [Arthrobacter sp. StoSoilB13]|uniref:hypothetical protein n=1 Tax=Arthrobacter sp. StoSoilB13 TaxID=2830993 RepID=UPI001CC75002|nr:hypothetical protein [Arthrobacter sp. StoSoilB13]